MRCYRLFFLLSLSFFTTSFVSSAQILTKDSEIPEIGKPCPNYVFTDLAGYRAKSVSINDFKGKWLFIDVWSIYCSGCLASMPKMNSLQEQFKDRITILMVGENKSLQSDPLKKEKTVKTWKYMCDRHSLKLMTAFDSLIMDKWKVSGLPLIVGVDPEGIVRLLTTSLDSTKLDKLIHEKATILEATSINDGKTQTLYPLNEERYNRALPILTSGGAANLGSDTSFLFRSLLTKWDSLSMPRYDNRLGLWIARGMGLAKTPYSEGDKQVFELGGYTLSELYFIAYTGRKPKEYPRSWEDKTYGEFSGYPLIELKDPKPFFKVFGQNGHRYCYSLTVPNLPKYDNKYMMGVMQRDLQNYFGYKVTLEKRMMPVINLVVVDKTKAKQLLTGRTLSKKELQIEKEAQAVSTSLSHFIKNEPISSIISYLLRIQPKLPQYAFDGLDEFQIPFIDKTGITDNITLTLIGSNKDEQSIKRQLAEYGLGFEKGEKEMEVIVIRDPE